MKSIEQLKQEQAAQVAALEKELNLAERLPVVPVRLGYYVRSLPALVTYEVEGIRGAVELLQKFPAVVPMYYWRDTFGHIKPLPEGEKGEAIDSIGGPFACYLDVSHNAGSGRYYTQVDLEFFAMVDGGELVQVCAKIKGPDYIGNYSALRPELTENREPHTGRVISRTFSPNLEGRTVADLPVTFAFGGGGRVAEGSNIRYCFAADQADTIPGADQTHAAHMLGILADRLKEPGEPVEGR